MNHQEALTEYLSAFVDELVKAGVKEAVISPGSRSTPLALMMAEHPELSIHVQIDERSAAFFALGAAKASRSPVALLCTSGTAAANYYPAVIEAQLARVPLIVLTADRPHELRNVGAPQEINQLRLYGEHTKWFCEMALPESGKEMAVYVRTTAARAAEAASQAPAGPVHLNFPFREPLIPILEPSPFEAGTSQRPIVLERGIVRIPEESASAIASRLKHQEKGLIVCGPIDEPGFAEAVLKLSRTTGYPILADPLSQLRSSNLIASSIIDSYDAILKGGPSDWILKAEVVIRFGSIPVSKPLTKYLKSLSGADHYIVDGGAGWRDPLRVGTHIIPCGEKEFCEDVSRYLPSSTASGWLTAWTELNAIVKETVTAAFRNEPELDEGKLALELAELLPEGSTLFAGNSMPIRDLDTFFLCNNKNIRVMANRGANGIDGVISTALGASLHEQPLYLLIGDLSFFHDMNGLLAAKLHKLDITIILINNDGGGIFSYLPQANEPKHFEVLFGTPTGLNFEHAVKLYSGRYTKVFDWEGYRTAVMESAGLPGLKVIEVPTDREKNVKAHRNMWDNVSREIQKFFRR